MKRYTYFPHLDKVNMSYFEHMTHSLKFSRLFFEGAYKAFIHAIYPNSFQTSTTDIQKEIYDNLR